MALAHLRIPAPGSGFVSAFIDPAFNENTFLWDTCFMTMFCNYAHPLVPGISSLDNFYAHQHSDGEICREISRATGADYAPWVNQEHKPLFSRWGWPESITSGVRGHMMPVRYIGRSAPKDNPDLTLDGLNHPIAAWAELVSFEITGDRERLSKVWEPLVRYFLAVKTYLRQGNGLYMTDWASMDNSPRNFYLANGGTAIDTSSEMVLFARNLAEMAAILNKPEAAAAFGREADELVQRVNQQMWNSTRHFYFDLTVDGKPILTIAAYWTLLVKVANPEQAKYLVSELQNSATFGRKNRVPSLAANQPGYDRNGGYWRGAVWSPTDEMVIAGLEQYGFRNLAASIARNHLEEVANTFQATGTIWENYSPDATQAGKPAKGDFVGWSGLAPITFLIRYGVGLEADARTNELTWRLPEGSRVGCRSFRFNGHIVSLLAEKRGAHSTRISVDTDGPFKLVIRREQASRTYIVKRGAQTFAFSEQGK